MRTIYNFNYRKTESFIKALDDANNIFTLDVDRLTYDGLSHHFYILGGCVEEESPSFYTASDVYGALITKLQKHQLAFTNVPRDFYIRGVFTSPEHKRKPGADSLQHRRTVNWEINDGSPYFKLDVSVNHHAKKSGLRLRPDHFTNEEFGIIPTFFHVDELWNPFQERNF